MKLSPMLVLFLLSLPLTACKDQSEASAILPKACASFPDTKIYKVVGHTHILWVQTNVDGISSSVANTMFRQACQQATYNLGKIRINIQTELSLDDKKALLVGFKRFWVLWLVRNGVDAQGIPVGYEIMNSDMLKDWFTKHIGGVPTPEQIEVVTLQDIQNTPKGEPMDIKTLAQIQQENRQQLNQNPP